MTKAYFLRGDGYLRYDVATDTADAGYPKHLDEGWSGLEGTGFESDVDSAIDLGNGYLYLFKGDSYLRVNQETNAVDGTVTPIADGWGGFADAGFSDSIGAALSWGSGKAYFFRDDVYLGYDIAGDSVDDGGALSIAEHWHGLADAGFGDSIDAAVNWGNGKIYFFKGDSYARYDVVNDLVDEGFPLPIADSWPGLGAAGFGDGVDTVWVKTAGSTPSPVASGLGPGDHVWFYDGRVSQALDIPQAEWFPGFTSPTDYQGHGEEIFNFVVHADGSILRGQPHMRNHAGTFAWLNNNPGNLTGVQGGPDLGQYAGKFNWHHFLIFPSREAGYDAIATFLRGASYRDLNITQALQRYAPASDGNDPVKYAQDVAQAAGVPTTTLIRDLDDTQMRVMQDKIAEIEGAVPGTTLTRDSEDLPAEVRALLG